MSTTVPGEPAGSQGEAVLAPHWYAEHLGDDVTGLEQAIAKHSPRLLVALSGRSRLLRGALIAAQLGRASRIALIFGDRGTVAAMAMAALRRRGRRMVVLEFLPRRRTPGLRGVVEHGFRRLVARPAMRRSMLRGQALTAAERELIASAYGLDPHRVRLIPWARSRTGRPPPPFDAEVEIDVFASGRASVDWPCLFEAVAGRPWRVEVACAKADLRLVERLNRDAGGQVRVYCEIPRARHDELLRSAKVFALVLRADGPGAGHVRLTAAADAGTSVVASDVAGLDGYVDDRTAVLVPPGDAAALGRAIQQLLDDSDRRQQLRDAAASAGSARTYADYFREIGALLAE